MDPEDSGSARPGLTGPHSAAAALPSLRPRGRALPRRPQLQAFDLNPPWTQPPLATASCRCRVPRRPALRPARPPGRRGPLSDDHTWASAGPPSLTSGNPDLPPPAPAHVPEAATTHQLSPGRALHWPLTFKGLRVLCPPGQSWLRTAPAAQPCAFLWVLGSCAAQRCPLSGKPAGLVRRGRPRRPLEKGAALRAASSTLSWGHGPAWPRMGPREALHRSVLLCVSRVPICSRHPRLQELLPQQGAGGGWEGGVLGSVGHREPSRGSDHPQALVGTPRPGCSPRASTA